MASRSTVPDPSGLVAVFRGVGLLTGAGAVTAVGNLAFNVVVARSAGVQTYGALGALVAAPMIAGLLATGMQFAVARLTVSTAVPARRLLWWATRASVAWLLIPTAMAIASQPLARYLHLASPLPVLLTALSFVVVLLSAVPGGVLIGRQSYVVLAAVGVITPMIRVPMGALLARGPDPLDGALLGSVLPLVAAWIATMLFALRSIDASEAVVDETHAATARIGWEGSAGAIVAASIWGIWTAPTVFGRHWLPAVSAGDLAAAQALASGAIYMSASVLTAFFPAVVRTRDVNAVLIGLVATVAIVVSTTGATFLLGRPILMRAYSSQFSFPTSLAIPLSVSAGAVALANYAVWVLRGIRFNSLAASLSVVVAVLVEASAALASHASAETLALQPTLAVLAGALAFGAAAVGRRGSSRQRNAGLLPSTPERDHAF